MNKNFLGTQPFFYLVTLIAMIVAVAFFGVKLVQTNQARELVGQSIKLKEIERERLRKEIAQNDERLRKFTEPLSLQRSLEQRARSSGMNVTLGRVTPNQILEIPAGGRGLSSFAAPATIEPVQFTVMDLAFMAPGTERDTMRR